MKSLDFGRYVLTSCVARRVRRIAAADRRAGRDSASPALVIKS
jgi:hypothetical protein